MKNNSLFDQEQKKEIRISVDTLGGENGEHAVIKGLELVRKQFPYVSYILHGNSKNLLLILNHYPELKKLSILKNAKTAVLMTQKPTDALRNGKGTSMLSSIESVEKSQADAAVSCGNTGALMLMSLVKLRKIYGVNRPAIAVLWPSRNPSGFNIVLDAGADVKADTQDLLKYAVMGSTYAQNGFNISAPRVGLLNVGTEDIKGSKHLSDANEIIKKASRNTNFEYVGFVEGTDLPSNNVDVIVTDGFTGNIALKTGEGTAQLIGDFMVDSFKQNLISKISSVLAIQPLKRLKEKMDPRRVNGGVLLGLNGLIIKSHGNADHVGIEAAVKLAIRLTSNSFSENLSTNLKNIDSENEFQNKE